MSHGYGPAERDNKESARVVHRALELGVTLFDTADVYGPETNEELLGAALLGRRAEAVIATKCGLVLGPDGGLRPDGRPERLRRACEGSLRRLRTEVIDLYQLHRIDPAVPLLETWGALADLVRAGMVRALGISHATVAELTAAHNAFPISTVQYELSVWSTANRADILPWCRRNSVGFLAFSPIGRGYLTGTVTGAVLDADDSRLRDPRFDGAAMIANRTILDGLRRVGQRRGATTAQVAIAWTLAQGDDVVPIPGTRHLRWLNENAAAADVVLSAQDLAELDALPPSVGTKQWDFARSPA